MVEIAATISVKEATGSGPTNTTITNMRYCTTDGQDTSTYPLVKPSSGTNYSYVKWIRLNADTAPTGTINNVKFYTDGTNSYGTGVTVKGITTGTYAQATGTQGTSGDLSSTVYTSGTDVFTYTSASPLSVTGTITSTTGIITNYVATQMALSTSVTAGTLSAETFTWRYDET